MSQISRGNAWKPRSKVSRTDSFKFVTSYNPILSNSNSLINTFLPILHAYLDTKEIFPKKYEKTSKKMLAQSSHPKSVSSQVDIKQHVITVTFENAI